MTLKFPDVSRFTPNVDISPFPVVIARSGMSDGTHNNQDEHDSSYPHYRDAAHAQGKVFGAYHWINHGKGHACAASAFSITGAGVPMLIDGEDLPGNTGYNGTLTVADFLDFAQEFRALGGTCNQAYLPHWYWQRMGSPNLQPLVDAGLHLVSSNYTSYSDTGPGWVGYGGMVPDQWQYQGSPVDMNAYRGTVAEYAAMIGAVVLVSTPPVTISNRTTEAIVQALPTLRRGDSGHYVAILEGLLIGHGYPTSSTDAKSVDGSFGPTVEASVRKLQAARGLTVDGVVGTGQTWPALLDV